MKEIDYYLKDDSDVKERSDCLQEERQASGKPHDVSLNKKPLPGAIL